MLSTALALARKGLAVFPCAPGQKTPACTHGCKDATTDEITIQTWFGENPNYNIGVATGAVSGFWALDVDGAEAALSRLEAEHSALPQTVEVITARGRHLYFKYPGGAAVDDTSNIVRLAALQDEQTMLPPPSAPMAVAREYVEQHCRHGDSGALTLRYWRGGWWQWRTSHWKEIENRAVRGMLYAFTENAMYATDGGPRPWLPTSRKISDVADALIGITLLTEDINQPCWTDGRENGNIVATANGLLDVTSRHLHAHTPHYFNQTAVPFDYDGDASEPVQWLEFLGELWPQEPEAIDVLAEWFGYVISGRTALHKIMLMIGPTRGGKGAIARVLTALIGRQNVAGPTLHSLGGEFGLAPLLGKPLAVISDARFSTKGANTVVERLLAISGEDAITVNRKFRDQWTGKLPSRLHVISNELPKLGDASTAIVGRMVLLMLTRSWLGREDHDLEDRLHAELPAILNWSLDGLERLTGNDGKFTRMESAEEAIIAMRDLASPVAAFVREKCEIGAGKEVDTETLFTAYKTWCELTENRKVSREVFGRNLHAAVPSVRKERPRDNAGRVHVYTGIGLKP